MTNDDALAVNFVEEPTAQDRTDVEAGLAYLRARARELHSVRDDASAALATAVPSPLDAETPAAEPDLQTFEAAHAALVREHETFSAALPFDAPLPGGTGQAQAPAAAPATPSSDVFAIPFHYDWRWHHGSFAMTTTHLPTGRITISAFGRNRIDSHAGFGVTVRAERDQFMTARSLRRSSDWAEVLSTVTGAVALAEGGTEMTVMEGSTLRGLAVDKRFRFRRNPSFWGSPERVSHNSGGFFTGAPIEVRWFAQRWHTYHVNVGAWVLAEWTTGDHAAGDVARSSGGVAADVLTISVIHG